MGNTFVCLAVTPAGRVTRFERALTAACFRKIRVPHSRHPSMSAVEDRRRFGQYHRPMASPSRFWSHVAVNNGGMNNETLVNGSLRVVSFGLLRSRARKVKT